MCEKVYQSAICWEFSELFTTPCQSLMVPQVQIGTRPIPNRIAAWRASSSSAMPAQPSGRKAVVDLAAGVAASVMALGSSGVRARPA